MAAQTLVDESLDRRVLIASAAAYTIAIATNWLQPVLVTEILAVKGATEASAGLVVAVEMVAVALSSAACTKFGKGLSFLAIALAGTMVAAIGNVLSLVAPNHLSLLAARVLCGIGEGAPYMVCNAALARVADPDRAYAKINVSTIMLGTALIYVAPLVGHVTGGRMAYPTLLVCFAVLLPILFVMPRTERYTPAETPMGQERVNSLWILMMSFGAVAFGMTYGAMWSFCLVLGERTGLSSDAVTHAIAVAIMVALGGSLLASAMGSRFGRLAPLGVGLIVLTSAMVCVSNTHHPRVYSIAMGIDMIAVYFLQPYFFGYAAAADPSGRAPATLGAAFFFSIAIGPYLGGILFERFGYSVIGWVAIVANSFAFAIFFFVDKKLSETANRRIRLVRYSVDSGTT